jgi:hypothetical protein
MKVNVLMEGKKGKVSFDMELEPENVSFDNMKMFFDKALEAYQTMANEEQKNSNDGAF